MSHIHESDKQQVDDFWNDAAYGENLCRQSADRLVYMV